MDIQDDIQHSIHIVDRRLISKFISRPEFPYLISMQRTGSHWLRMIMELYFEKPSLVRIFYYTKSKDFTCYHRHDENLDIEHENVIYLYRYPVDTIYSILAHYGESLEDLGRIRYWADLYGRHLAKWILDEGFTKKKTLITYEGMKHNMEEEFGKICRHFSASFDSNRLERASRQVTKSEVRQRNPHDPRVIKMSDEYHRGKKGFAARYSGVILDCIYAVNENLENCLDSLEKMRQKERWR